MTHLVLTIKQATMPHHHQVEIDGIPIEILQKPIKHIHLRIYPPDGRVQISAPLTFSVKQICRQVESKLAWLHKQRARLLSIPNRPEATLSSGETLYFLGKAYTLTTIETQNTSSITLNNHQLILNVKPEATLNQKKQIINHWYRGEMQTLMPTLIAKWQPHIGVMIHGWGAKLMKTRWGSCNVRTKHIWLNLNLMQRPILCLEYVLVHEMVHLLEPSHNRRFYQLMDTFMPDWKIHKNNLSVCLPHNAS